MANVESKDLEGLVVKIAACRQPIEGSTRLYHDLRISGDDAFELIDEIWKNFGTKFDGFKWDIYFPNESEALFFHICRIFGGDKKFRPLTFDHLLNVVRTGYWFEPPA